MNVSENIHQPLIDVALGMYKRLGFKSVSMDDIARELGVSKKTLYQLVSNKEELITLVMEFDFAGDLKRFRDNHDQAKDAIDEFLRNSRYFIREMREMSPSAIRDLQKYYPAIWRGMVQTHHNEFRKNLEANLERGVEEGLYRAGFDANILSTLYSGMMMMVIDREVFPAHDRPLSDVIRQLTEYHFHGIVNQFGRDRLEKYLHKESLG